MDVEGITWKKLWFYLKPINPREYLQVLRDANLPRWRDKLAFIWLLNRLKYGSALQVLGYWLNSQRAKLRGRDLLRVSGLYP
jgi:hypothetical protein